VSAGTGLASGATTTAKIVMIPGASLTAPRLKGRARSNVTLTLRTSPGLKNVTTRLQRLSTTWIDAGPHNTNPAGVVTYTVRFPARGASTKVRVLIPASVGYGATVSNVLTLTGT
jgi:hypothetical protein